MWFSELVGFEETETDDIAAQFALDGRYLTSKANGRRMKYGFSTPSLAEFRDCTRKLRHGSSPLELNEVVNEVQKLHLDPQNAGAFFQVASQFNTLEMVSPSVTPEDGIDRYSTDKTQGPACAIACGAGTISASDPVARNRGFSCVA